MPVPPAAELPPAAAPAPVEVPVEVPPAQLDLPAVEVPPLASAAPAVEPGPAAQALKSAQENMREIAADMREMELPQAQP